jgi:hypothetical protein
MRRRSMRIIARRSSSISSTGDGSGRIALFRSYVALVNARRLAEDNGGTCFIFEEASCVDRHVIDRDDVATMMLPVIRFVGDRVGTGERCVRSDHPFPPACRRVITTVAASTSSSSRASSSSYGGHRNRRQMTGFLNSLLVGKRCDDGGTSEGSAWDDADDSNINDDDGVAPTSPGQLIMSRCKRGIVGKLASLRGGIKRASSIRGDGHRNDNDNGGYLVGHLRPFVVPTVVSNDGRGGMSRRGLVVDVTPTLVAYFEVTIVKVRSSATGTTERGAVVDGVAPPPEYHHRAIEDAANVRHRQRREGRHHGLNWAPAWMPMMMMPMYPFPVEVISTMNAFEWDRMPPGAGGRGGAGAGFNHGVLRDHERRRHEVQLRMEREREHHVRRERREEQRHGQPGQHGEIDARRVRHQDQQDQQHRGHRHECVAIGLSTRYFSPVDKMPGWDSESYGYHGDDGGIYHGRGVMLSRYGPSYGPGDTVGCGLDYASRRIFFVKNGVFLGYAFGDGCDDISGGGGGLSRRIMDRGLYPTVGVDTECPISVNFGERPFMFNLRGFSSAAESGVVKS